MIEKLVSTENGYAGLMLRVGLGIVILPHGYQKLVGFSNILNVLESYYHLPMLIGVLVILIEFFCSALLLLGCFTRINAALLAVVLFGAAFYHLEHGFFMNWFGNQAGEGIQFSLLFVCAAVALTFLGGGKWSIDTLLQQKFESR